MLSLKETYRTTHLTTRSLAKKVFEDLMQRNASEQVLDFSDIEFVSRSFMVQLYAMLAKKRSQARFINMNDEVEQMYQLAVRAYNTPAILTDSMSNSSTPTVLTIS
ncbi:MAG: hypothetical protein U5K31_08855 [Balneolaceae bacterium]|nr:hypothetical protein [Balneolaceae bacterium]